MQQRPYLLKNGVIYDGTGSSPEQADVLIVGARIAQVGKIRNSDVPARPVIIECGGLCVSPGFIDMHSHSDSGLPLYPEAECLIRQGITTSIGGNCGSSAAGIPYDDEAEWRRYLEAGLEKWNGLSEFLNAIDAIQPAVNLGMLVGHGDLRRTVSPETSLPLDCAQRAHLNLLTKEAILQGAFGVSSGLEYVPGRFASQDELIELSKGAARFDGIHSSHIRNEGPNLLESIGEVVRIAEDSKVRFEVSHLKACGPRNWGKVSKALEMLDAARTRGFDISCDFYPYLASSTGLSIVLPDWALENGKTAALGLLSSQKRSQIAAQSDERTIEQGGWDKVVITSVSTETDAWMQGMNVSAIAERLHLSPSYAAIEILVRNQMDVGIARHAMSERDLIAVMKYPSSTVITDGNVSVPEKGNLHPRSIGTFPRLLGTYVREMKVLSMEEAIRKSTSLPARKIGISNRGVIKKGYMADLVIFDPLKIKDMSTYEEPWQYPRGIEWVFVNGVPVIKEEIVTGNRPGTALRNQVRTVNGLG